MNITLFSKYMFQIDFAHKKLSGGINKLPGFRLLIPLMFRYLLSIKFLLRKYACMQAGNRVVAKLAATLIIWIYFLSVSPGCSENPKVAENAKDREAALVYTLTGSAGSSLAVTGCGTGSGGSSFAANFSPAVTSCTGCHSGGGPSGGFDITNYTAAKSRIIPGDPANSLLYTKITTGSMKGYSTTTINNAALNWICGGGNP